MSNKIVALVKSPARSVQLREGRGFSLLEIKEAGKTVGELNELQIKVDYFRKSKHDSNIALLKAIKVSEKKVKVRKPFVKKEKKRTPFLPKIEKVEVKPVVEKKVAPEKPVKKKKPSKKVVEKKVKVPKLKEGKLKPKVEEEKKEIPEGTPLTELSGLGQTTAKKFYELGVNTIEDLCQENPEELAPLLKGVSEERLKGWCEEGKKYLSNKTK